MKRQQYEVLRGCVGPEGPLVKGETVSLMEHEAKPLVRMGRIRLVPAPAPVAAEDPGEGEPAEESEPAGRETATVGKRRRKATTGEQQ